MSRDYPIQHQRKLKIANSRDFLDVELARYKKSVFQKEDLLECIELSNNKNKYTSPKFKFFIYDLPPTFNLDLQDCVSRPDPSINARHCGTGNQMYTTKNMTAYDTWQFALEVILHHKLMFSPHRTLDPEQADAFYIPFYSSSACFCDHYSTENPSSRVLEDELVAFLMNSTYYRKGIPHFMALSRIQREHADPSCTLLYHQEFSNVTFVGIERESRHQRLEHALKIPLPRIPLVVVPYPSYGYLHPNHDGKYLESIKNQPRNTLVLLAASVQPKNPLRAKLLEQFSHHSTNKSAEEYFKLNPDKEIVNRILFVTPESHLDHRKHTLDWMARSHFCLQPKGDSPTRKSFYDSIISGCIPVLFSDGTYVPYPFERHIDYASFVVTIDEWYILSGGDIVDKLIEISQKGKTTETKYSLDDVMDANKQHDNKK